MNDSVHKNSLKVAFATWEADQAAGRVPLKEQLEAVRAQFIGFRVGFENTILTAANQISRESSLIAADTVPAMVTFNQLTAFLNDEARWSGAVQVYAPNLTFPSESRFRSSHVKKFLVRLIEERSVLNSIETIKEDLERTNEDYRVATLVGARQAKEKKLVTLQQRRRKEQAKVAPGLLLFHSAAESMRDDLVDLVVGLDAAIAELEKEPAAASMDRVEAVVKRLLKKAL